MRSNLRILLVSLMLSLSLGFGAQAFSTSAAQTTADSPVVPDVAVLPYTRGGDVWLAEVNGRRQWQMTESGLAWSPALSSDGAYLAYVVKPAGDAPAELWLANLRGGAAQRLDSGPAPWGTPSWSPDGRTLAWVRGQSLVISELGGATQALVENLSVQGMERPEAVWSQDGDQILCSFVVDGQRSLWAVPLDSGPWTLLTALSDDGPVVTDVSAAAQRMALWQPGALRLLPLPGKAEPTAQSLSLDAIPSAVTQMAWAPDGTHLALRDVAGAIWLSGLDGWDLQGIPLDGLQASRLTWLADGRLAFWVQGADPRDEAVHLVKNLTSGGAQRLSPALATFSVLDVPAPTAGASSVNPGFEWYRYQGEWDSGAMAHSNCGPTSVAMAIQFARNNLWVPISDIRNYIGGTSWTYVGMLQSALTHWQVPNRRLGSMQEINDAIAVRGSIVLVHVYMSWIGPGADYQQPNSSATGANGRYYAYSQSHWLVLKGFSADGQWVICNDPNVWDGNGVYWYSNGLPKGKNRLYRYTELANAINAYGYEAIEVFAAGSAPATSTPTITSTPTPAGAGVWYTVVRGDTLGSIAQRFQVSMASIVQANGITNPNLLTVGRRLWIPSGSAPAPTATRTPTRIPTQTPTRTATTVLTPSPTATPGLGFWYTVQRGDTLALIAARYGVSVWTIATANRLSNPNLLAIGQRLWIPTSSMPAATPTVSASATPRPAATATPTPGAGRWYTVQSGDTLSVIAARFGVTTWAIASANGLWNLNLIWVGQRLWIPGVP
ncbi:MAG: LysM peptidoglycan-binding domain-containing protein [Anaerolineae bacterium]